MKGEITKFKKTPQIRILNPIKSRICDIQLEKIMVNKTTF